LLEKEAEETKGDDGKEGGRKGGKTV